jgi:tRNA(Ile)-lysidine synthase
VIAWAGKRPADERWAVAVSGGSDSICLVLLLWAHWPERRRRLRVLHFDHRLRGAAARADARFCRRVSAALGLDSSEGVWDGAPASASEAEARDARFAFFGREARRRRLGAVWLGHNQDDVAESLLMRLARGSGAGGLAAPRPVQSRGSGFARVRPLLNLKKSEIVLALRRAGAVWREDETNAAGTYFRNRVRRRVVPAWLKAAGRDAVSGAARSRELLEEDDEALESRVDELRALTRGGKLDLSRLAGEPRAILRRALHRWVLAQPARGELSRRGFESLLAAVEKGKPTRQSFGPAALAVIRGGRLALEPVASPQKRRPAA